MDIVYINVIFVGQLCSIQLADPKIFEVSEITRFLKLPVFTLLVFVTLIHCQDMQVGGSTL